MAGGQCSEFGATKLKDSNYLCIASGENAGLITYQDGRVAILTEDSPDGSDGKLTFVGPNGKGTIEVSQLSADQVALIRRKQGGEIGYCTNQGALSTSAWSTLQTSLKGSPVTWTDEHLLELRRLMGVGPRDSGYAFMCAEPGNSGRIAVGIDPIHRTSTLAALKALEDGEGSFDSAHREAAIESLRAMTGSQPPQSHWEYALVGILVFVVGGVLSHVIGHWLTNRRGGGKGDGDGSGSGGGGSREIETLVQAAVQGAIQGIFGATQAPAGEKPADPQVEGFVATLDGVDGLKSASERAEEPVNARMAETVEIGGRAPAIKAALPAPAVRAPAPVRVPARVLVRAVP